MGNDLCMKIGFFDSGLGGINILKAVIQELPEYSYEFYGDTANLPYGDKKEDEIYDLTERGVRYLFERNCALVIVACNTASAETLRKLQIKFLTKHYPDRKILGVIIPTIETVLESSIKNITLIGTRRTVESRKYELEFTKLGADVVVDAKATPTLVPLIENGQFDTAHNMTIKIIEVGQGERGAILGCTHYTALKEKLNEHFKDQAVKIFSQDEIIPNKLKTYLENHPEIKNRLNRLGQKNIHLTKLNGEYNKLINELLT